MYEIKEEKCIFASLLEMTKNDYLWQRIVILENLVRLRIRRPSL